MDQITFARVSIEEAKAALSAHAGATRAAPQLTERWETRRGPQSMVAPVLAGQTFKWLATLPKETRPNALASQFPRIANRLAEIWKRSLQCERYLDDLMLDRRSGRQGFPSEVVADIVRLKAYFMSTSRTARFSVWGERIDVE